MDAVYTIEQRSHYDTTKSTASFTVVLPQIRELMQDGRFLIIRYTGGDKTRFEFDGDYQEAEARGKAVLNEINTRLSSFYKT